MEFYRGLFGWEFDDVMPPGSEAAYFMARIRVGDFAAVGSIPEGAPQIATCNTYVWVEEADGADPLRLLGPGRSSSNDSIGDHVGQVEPLRSRA